MAQAIAEIIDRGVERSYPTTSEAGVEIAKSLPIREAGHDEFWLQDQIYENPTCLNLGELEPVSKERPQSSGGRLDILLKDPEDDSMYEVEVMLGETDESHIIRTIEYWDNEKRRWPKRQHVAVLVAEHINRRFFNVIQLLSHAVPIVAIQVSMLTVNGTKALHFTTVLDTFEDIDDGTDVGGRVYTREDWLDKAKWTVETADALLQATSGIFPSPVLNYLKGYVAITVNGHNYMWMHKRSADKSLLIFRMAQSLQDEAAALLEGKSIIFTRRPHTFRFMTDKKMVEKNADLFVSLAKLVKKSWEVD
jgi:hypothetical protein